MRLLLVTIIIVSATATAARAGPMHVVLDFEDLSYGEMLSGTDYADCTWEWGNGGYQGQQGYWKVPNGGPTSYPATGIHNVINNFGDTELGITFNTSVHVLGTFIAGQGSPAVWTTGVRVHGFVDGIEVVTTDWFTDIDDEPDWWPLNLHAVDRVVFEAIPVLEGGGWFSIDAFTFEHTPEPTSLTLLALGAWAVLRRKR